MEHPESVQPRKKKGFLMKLLLNLAVMAAIGILLIIGALYWLDHWTLHGEQAIVPDVKGRPYQSALTALRSEGFEVVLSDSIYDRATRPGTVVEQNPKVNSRVKPGRTVYLTINAFSPKNVTVPALTDISVRQARSILEALGITRIEEVSVRSEFRDLVIGVRSGGTALLPGARIPVTAVVRLEVGDGLAGDNVAGESQDASTNATQNDLLDLL